MNVNEAAGFLQGRIKHTLDIPVPIETKELGEKKKQWCTLGISTSSRTARILYKKFKKCHSDDNRQLYKKG